MPFDPRHASRSVVDGPDRAAARAMLHAVGYTPEDLSKPLVMVAHEWIGTMPCNFSQRALAQRRDGGYPRGRRDADGGQYRLDQ